MNEKEYVETVSREISEAVGKFDQDQLAALVEAILQANRVFVCGTGRSLMMMKAFAMRLMHAGVAAYVVGETITPAIAQGDLLIAGSGSGQTQTTLAMIQAAADRGADTAVMTGHRTSPVAEACDLVVEVPAPVTSDAALGTSVQLPGSLFEQCLLVMAAALVLKVMGRLGTTLADMRSRHTKLE